MTLLRDREWRIKYTPDDGDLVRLLYVPALRAAVRYDRLTGYFSASALTLAARGVEGLVVNRGHMRLIVGCTLDPPEIEAITRGEALRAVVERTLRAVPLDPVRPEASDGLELLAWMVAEGFLDVKVAVPCDAARRPVPGIGIFHEKAGIVEDKVGDVLAFNGSLNESETGWTRNWEVAQRLHLLGGSEAGRAGGGEFRPAVGRPGAVRHHARSAGGAARRSAALPAEGQHAGAVARARARACPAAGRGGAGTRAAAARSAPAGLGLHPYRADPARQAASLSAKQPARCTPGRTRSAPSSGCIAPGPRSC